MSSQRVPLLTPTAQQCVFNGFEDISRSKRGGIQTGIPDPHPIPIIRSRIFHRSPDRNIAVLPTAGITVETPKDLKGSPNQDLDVASLLFRRR